MFYFYGYRSTANGGGVILFYPLITLF